MGFLEYGWRFRKARISLLERFEELEASATFSETYQNPFLWMSVTCNNRDIVGSGVPAFQRYHQGFYCSKTVGTLAWHFLFQE